jgi:hypothetical protein
MRSITGVAVTAACTAGRPPPATIAGARTADPAIAMPSLHGVTTAVTAPPHARYVAGSLGIAGESVSLHIRNDGNAPVTLGSLRVRYSASRRGVFFPCREPRPAAHEPRSLLPRQSFDFERELCCSTPVPGVYDIGVYVGLDDEEPVNVATFSLDVEGGAVVPQPYPTLPGVYGLMVGDSTARPMPAAAWARGDYHVVVAVINAGRLSAHLGTGRLQLSTYKAGSPFPCARTEPLALENELRPGQTQVILAPVRCAPAEEGHFVIVGSLTVGDHGPPVAIGDVRLTVTGNPLQFAPSTEYPWNRSSIDDFPH